MELRRPTLADKDTILDMMAEFDKSGSDHDGGFWDPETFNYEEWLENNLANEQGLNLPEGWVPAIQIVAFDENKQEALGFVNLRLRLNDYLINQGGHIGYSVRPSQRGKGYAKAMLKEAIALAKQKNIRNILVTCSKDNAASRAVILANHGQLEDTREGVQRYWIEGDHHQ